ncbi:MAG TPA: polyphosphate kinase 1 [Mucilaginibacter sp.]|nr:polyphosphate kinase 1 [Mucilaginibacter sp.]
MEPVFFDRDLSWLMFNRRVLEEAERDSVPLMERIRFLSIYSSNLDEFYRVRIPVMRAFNVLEEKGKSIGADHYSTASNLYKAQQEVAEQQQKFGSILRDKLLPLLNKEKIKLFYNESLPPFMQTAATSWFFNEVLGYLQPQHLGNGSPDFYPENNKLYFLIFLRPDDGTEKIVILNIPSDKLPRFYTLTNADGRFILFLDDIIRYNLDKLFPGETVNGCFSFKITRDAELDLKDEYEGDTADLIEKQLSKRDLGLATRFLHQPGIPLRYLHTAARQLGLDDNGIVEGGIYHNLKDLSALPVKDAALQYDKWPALNTQLPVNSFLLDHLKEKDMIVHTPYQSYSPVLRFFNEAATHPDVTEIYVTLYRIANDSRIANALISAAKNGKKVKVLVELKARFDEANNIKWAKRMKAAGVEIIYSVTALKVHAKVALVKRREGLREQYYGLLATGNFNEGTAAFYTDHILMTSSPKLLREMELIFIFLAKRKKPVQADHISFEHLLVSQFNLQTRFFELIDREIANAGKGLPAGITIKLNNLEERKLISKLYEASIAGVKISLIVRSICCVVAGIKGLSENITVTRIVDRYLEHGRIFIFNNNNDPEVFMGSADWMNRNIYRRIEVCFPVYNQEIKKQIIAITQLQLRDNTQAVWIDSEMNNVPKHSSKGEQPVQSQKEIYNNLATNGTV